MNRRYALSILCLAGCASGGDPVPTPVPVPAMQVEWVNASALSEADKDVALKAYAFHRASWVESQHRSAPIVTKLTLWGTATLPPLNENNDGLYGQSHWNGSTEVSDGSGTITMVVGPDLSCPYTMHELEHLALGDSHHLNPAWPGLEAAQVASVTSWRAARPQ